MVAYPNGLDPPGPCTTFNPVPVVGRTSSSIQCPRLLFNPCFFRRSVLVIYYNSGSLKLLESQFMDSVRVSHRHFLHLPRFLIPRWAAAGGLKRDFSKPWRYLCRYLGDHSSTVQYCCNCTAPLRWQSCQHNVYTDACVPLLYLRNCHVKILSLQHCNPITVCMFEYSVKCLFSYTCIRSYTNRMYIYIYINLFTLPLPFTVLTLLLCMPGKHTHTGRAHNMLFSDL